MVVKHGRIKTVTVYRQAFKQSTLKQIEKLADKVTKQINQSTKLSAELHNASQHLLKITTGHRVQENLKPTVEIKPDPHFNPRNEQSLKRTVTAISLPSPPSINNPLVQCDSSLSKGERKVLSAVAQSGSGCSLTELTLLTGYKATSRYEFIRQLKSKGLVEGSGPIVATAAGISALGTDYQRLPTGDALREHWARTLAGGELRIFEIITSKYPEPIHKDQIAVEANYKSTSTYEFLRQLKARKLVVDAGRGQVKAAPELFG